MGLLETLYPAECACTECVEACVRPCWPTPADARALIDAGHGDKLMLDKWGGSPRVPQGEFDPSNENVDILCPANPGQEGQYSPALNLLDLLSMITNSPTVMQTGCVFHENGLCVLHDSGLKPTEGKLTMCCDPGRHEKDGMSLHQAVAITWESEEGRAVVAAWKQGRNLGERTPDGGIF